MLHDIVFSEQARGLQALARELADRHVRPRAAHCDHAREFNHVAARAAAEAGLYAACVPRAYGGSGAGTLALCLATEELSRADPAFGAAFAVNALGATPIVLAGTEEQKERWLPAIARGDESAAFCLSEKNAGSDVAALTATAERDGDDYVICGEKKWTTNAGLAGLYVVFCVTDPTSRTRRVSAFVVERGRPGFSVRKVEDKLGLHGVPVAETHFDHVRVPAANLVGGRAGHGFQQAMATLDRARPCVAAQAVGTAQGALDLALVYAHRRRQFGERLTGFQMVQQLLADMAVQTEAARWLAYAAAAQVDAGDRPATAMAAMSKCFASDVALRVATDAVQVFGGYGLVEDYPVARYFRDAKILQVYEGTNQVQRLVVARNLVKRIEDLAHLEAYLPAEEQRTYRSGEE